uniref:ret finger protein-like 4A n=1 Tax=Jaculus jaculus TaxID=51337 RepID=UPI001E1B0206|nr:ret finger protein-like 4A [Jaculus jaculus]
MAHHFKDASACPVCLRYFDDPVYLKCGYVCCFRCMDSMQKNPRGEGLLCPHCSEVSEEKDVEHAVQLGKLVSKVKELEPQLKNALKMNPRVRKFQVDMTLDVDTAHDHLIISDDLRKVHCGSGKQGRKQCAQRFQVSMCVLGSSRFTSHRHYWEVDVGSSREWDIGVCKESIDRTEPVVLAEGRGFWTVGLRNGEVYAASTEPMTPLLVNPRLRRLGIFLDLLLSNISFYDVSDASHIFTFTDIPYSEPLRPFFAPANPTPDHQDPLGICPAVKIGIFSLPANPEQGK